METAREIQELICEVRREPTTLVFQHFPSVKHWADMVVITMGDQAHANRPRGDSTGGLLTLLAGPESIQGRVCRMSLISWRTWKLKRKAISSNDAEVQAMIESEDHCFRTRLLWTELHGAGCAEHHRQREDHIDRAERQVIAIKGIVCTDSKGGWDSVQVNESPLLGLSNIRAALQAFQLRDNLLRTGGELRWLASDFDLGDALTKKRAECRTGIQKFLSSGQWCIMFDPLFVSAKRNKKAGKSAVDVLQRALNSETDQLTSFGVDAEWLSYFHDLS